MIIDSIETLERMTKQEIFEFVIKHLKEQKLQSRRTALNRDICAYRGANGRACAVGCLIPNDLYTPEFEGVIVTELKLMEGVNPRMLKVFDDNMDLLQKLQYLHDSEEIFDRIKPLVKKYITYRSLGLNVNFLDD